MGVKLKRGVLVGKRGGNSTPSPTWRFGFAQKTHGFYKEDLILPTTNTTTLSARKLGANLWEVLPQLNLKVAKMNKPEARVRSSTSYKPNHKEPNHKDKASVLLTQMGDPPDSPHDHEEPASTSSLRRHIAASLNQHHCLVERNSHSMQPIYPASCSSSMEVMPYNRATTPTSSLEIKGLTGDSNFRLKTSTELLKILNRIWSLEEQHASNMSLVNALKKELNHSRSRIKELTKDKQIHRQAMDDLMKQIARDKVIRKSKEEDRIRTAIQSVKEELEDERKLRKHSESLHRKLAWEILELKNSLSNGLKELERERKARVLLEDICDEFAKGIRDYESNLRSLKHKTGKDHVHRESPDRLILHLSEAWLDERMQMKLPESQSSIAEKNIIVDKLKFEIGTFLQAKQSTGSRKSNERSLCRHSLESLQLYEAGSAPQNGDDEMDSFSNNLNCFELNRASSGKRGSSSSKQKEENPMESHVKGGIKSHHTKQKTESRETAKDCNFASLQMQFKQHMDGALLHNGKRNALKDQEENSSRKLETSEVTRSVLPERKNKHSGNSTLELNSEFSNSIRKHSLSMECEKLRLGNNCKEDSCAHSKLMGHANASPVKEWISSFKVPDPEVSESSSKWPPGFKENTLKEKLLEARLEGQHSRSRVFRGSL